MVIQINIDTKDVRKGLQHYLKNVKRLVLETVAIQLQENIIDEITKGTFDTVGRSLVHGLVDLGKYKNSWVIKPMNEGDDNIIVASDDKKAKALEYGQAPEDVSDLTLEEIMDWASRKDIPPNTAKAIYEMIKQMGTVPKPAARRSIDKIKTQKGQIEEKVKSALDKKVVGYL